MKTLTKRVEEKILFEGKAIRSKYTQVCYRTNILIFKMFMSTLVNSVILDNKYGVRDSDNVKYLKNTQLQIAATRCNCKL